MMTTMKMNMIREITREYKYMFRNKPVQISPPRDARKRHGNGSFRGGGMTDPINGSALQAHYGLSDNCIQIPAVQSLISSMFAHI